MSESLVRPLAVVVRRQFTDFFVVMSFRFSEDPHMSLQVVITTAMTVLNDIYIYICSMSIVSSKNQFVL